MSYLELGYQVFNNVITDNCRESAKQEVYRIRNLFRQDKQLLSDYVVPLSKLPEHRNPGVNPQDTEEEPYLIGEPVELSSTFAALIINPGLWDIASSILGDDDVVYHFSNVTRKPANNGPSLSWHRDFPNQYICPEHSDCFFRLLLPLEGMQQTNGCTQVIANSHTLSDELAIREHKKRSLDIDQHDQSISLELEPGQAVAIHPKLIHGGQVNRSALDRNLMVIQFGLPTHHWLYHEEPCMLTGLNRDEILEMLNTNFSVTSELY
ncbi:MAG: phytanoyl-CoA dioxygenase family protein [Endozoicomonas sp.]|uniref:phytanoyl-CoA dioxygenase family protein n=1 Tax=Endozoicomonas sp. TaxID=1892382 RepID=UPI003D9BA929